jgi:N-acetyl-anhydromuramyl-L-alanine amidase AmpD
MRLLAHPSPHHSRRTVPCVAVCLHWTGGSFGSAVAWCQEPQSRVSYHEVIATNGAVAHLVDADRAAWAVGKSRAPEPFTGTAGNSMTYNIALAGAPPERPTAAQIASVIARCQAAFKAFGWPLTDRHRVTGHSDWAWPRGRKVDPVGDPTAPWLDLEAIRTALPLPLLAPVEAS